MQKIIYLSLGSNLGHREANLYRALSEIGNIPLTQVMDVSKIIETPPYGNTDQPEFLNLATRVISSLSPFTLLERFQEIEQKLGRVRKETWEARTIDIDIVFYENLVLRHPRLILPHYDMHNRLFVLEPLSEICPYFVHPLLGKTVVELYQSLLVKAK